MGLKLERACLQDAETDGSPLSPSWCGQSEAISNHSCDFHEADNAAPYAQSGQRNDSACVGVWLSAQSPQASSPAIPTASIGLRLTGYTVCLFLVTRCKLPPALLCLVSPWDLVWSTRRLCTTKNVITDHCFCQRKYFPPSRNVIDLHTWWSALLKFRKRKVGVVTD
jgi:hypothetical protein